MRESMKIRQNDRGDGDRLRKVRDLIYGLLADKGVLVEVNDTPPCANFCCLQIGQYPVRKATLIIGTFTDEFHEMVFVAHEYGHLLHYETLSPRNAEEAYCAVFASNHLGLENISREGKELITSIERNASVYALDLLSRVLDGETLSQVKEMYAGWIQGYCRKAGLSMENPLP
jgi:hypothetical protein